MPRRLRRDYVGALHHVLSRGIARRPIFETRRDVRFFLSRLAREVRRGDLEVLVYCVLTTHFHLLVRSPRGRLSASMQRVLDAYSRWFNRSRRRDGPLFASRFVNRLVESDAYAATVVRYIDDNPVAARLVERPADYPHGSARHYARQRGPRWLSRDGVEAIAGGGGGDGRPWDPDRYERCFGSGLAPGARWIVARRLWGRFRDGEEPLDELLDAAPDGVRRWMERKANLADGTRPGLPVASPGTLVRCVRDGAGSPAPALVRSGRRGVARREVLLSGLLRVGAGLAHEEIASRLGVPWTRVQVRLRLFRRAVRFDPGFRDEAAALLARALRIDHRSARPRREALGGAAETSTLEYE
ncbi:MAG TPA: transposase [Planctomycetota bacterium]|nr:transposase [Planctomycetota bacterium]